MKWILICFVFCGCLVGPNYRPPSPCVPNQWHAAATPLEPSIRWWENFNDPLLNKYIALAAVCNRDLLSAKANICQARAMKQMAASKLYPQINADFNALRLHLSKNAPFFSEVGAVPRPPFIPQTFNLYNALLDATWELDIFGKIRRQVEVQEAQIGVAIEQKNEVLISIFAEIALNYIQVRTSQQMIALIEQNIAFLEKNAFVVSEQLKKGYRNGVDLQLIEARVAEEVATLPNLFAEMFQGIYALSVLTGKLPETFLCELLPAQPLPLPPCDVAIGLRSDLLQRRPDVRLAERNLAAATANIGVATAQFFPSVSLLGFIGYESVSLRNLFSGKSLTWAIDGNASLPLFRGGNLVGNLQLTEAAAISACADFQQAVLTALEEAESALIAYNQELERATALNIAVEKNQKIVNITSAQLNKGLITVIDYLNTETALINSQQALLNSQSSRLQDLVILYKALGGGWECVP